MIGGKGGFGSLLRSNAKKVGQKETTNFDACRDLDGRRLRHVNNEKRLKEWKENEEARKLALEKLQQSLSAHKPPKQVDFDEDKYQSELDKVQKNTLESVEMGLKHLTNNTNNNNNNNTKTVNNSNNNNNNTSKNTPTTTTTTTSISKPTIGLILPDFSDDEDEE
ncbi:hypothetical protein DLAC_05642 [Tieghemostelium lacteum]|uniref:SDE2-like domain-containing protein n=1 Tax=Tieghemostelium lacteum TaxID=361077 RepID=A0A151ZGE1_TIELA|nr:hypothetical protein DLAC_05642 [Tieghemostelium lacteum]|eukprot:KYQ93033.1 hypothetical protein DLAC_05642 [Tieghemostelium lacteum]